MAEIWVSLSDVPAEGREFFFDDQDFWAERFTHFRMPLAVGKPITARLLAIPAGEGFAVQGQISGTVVAACDRCAKDTEVAVATDVEVFAEPGPEDLEGGEPLLREVNGATELNLGAILWEHFSLALPAKVLCSRACKGLCPECGADLNTEECRCARDEGDPRLAILRNLKVDPKKRN